MDQNTWQLQDAKTKFSQLVDSAMHHKPQFVTKHGNNAVVIISFEEYIKLTKPKDDLVTFLRNSPLSENDFEFTRNKDMPKDIEL
ncbi:MAG: type II toxin-antitoxin system Phd/YefM family antitoxin [Thiothrix sp.]|nr:MAG: type II toxin-antitoxin system Phd/YefM family antitoxin [Thiothrix sp.]